MKQLSAGAALRRRDEAFRWGFSAPEVLRSAFPKLGKQKRISSEQRLYELIRVKRQQIARLLAYSYITHRHT